MARSSCVTKFPDGDVFVTIRKSYVIVCGGDHCAAALLSEFVWLTDARIGSMASSGVTEGIAWVSISLESMASLMADHYSVRSIRDALKKLVSMGLLVEPEEENEGKVKSYVLNSGLLNHALPRLLDLSLDPPSDPGNSAGVYPGNFSAKFPQNCRGLGPALRTNEVFKEEEKEYTPPTPTPQSQNQTDEDSPFSVAEESSPSIGRDDLSPVDDSGEETEPTRKPKSKWKRMPKAEKPEGSTRAALRRLQESKNAEADPGQGSIANTSTPIRAIESIQNRSTPSNREIRVDFSARWDTKIPEFPVDWDDANDSALERQMGNPELRNRFDEIVNLSATIREAQNGSADWLTFHWLFRSKDGRPNWRRLLAGEFDWMKKRKMNRAESAADVVAKTLAMIDARED